MDGTTVNPFGQAALYIQAGWAGTLPLPLGAKFPPPGGFTGADGAVPEVTQVLAWAQAGPANIGLRLPTGVIGIDVDHYDGKPGADTLAELMARLGPLPATWSSTSRGADSPARVWLYRLPRADLRLVGKAGLGIDVLQHHHRYIVAAPSVHPEGGVYAWYRPDFTAAGPAELPLVADLPFLPEAWVTALTEQQERPMPPPAVTAGDQTTTGARPSPGFVDWAGQRPPHGLRQARAAIARELAAASAPASLGSGYRAVLLRAALVLGGYVGAGVLDTATAYSGLEDAAARAWGGQCDADDATWIRQGLEDGRARPFHVYDDLSSSVPGAPPALPPRALASLEHVRRFGRLPDTFDPAGDNSDMGLAREVLAEMWPNLRFDAESGAWLVRGGDRWSVVKRDTVAGWAVCEVAPRMPLGEQPVPKATAERTEGHWQAWRRAKLTSGAGSAPVSRKIREQLATTDHFAHVRSSELDADPDILWAGGQPWDLRTGALAEMDPLTPHTHTARFAPVEVPTPRWDAFVAAVWPDAEVREWALNNLAIGLTGHSPRVMPILYGDTGKGKTQVVSLLCNLLGTYGQQVDGRLIGRTEPPGHVVARLKGLRLAYLDEAAPVDHERVERVKMLTGGAGALTADAKYLDAFTWDPTHTLVLTQNRTPELTDDALRDRAQVILCDGDYEAVSAARKALGPVNGNTISGVWAQEAPGVLAAMMARAAAWLHDPDVLRRSTPASAAALVEEMVREQDPVGTWMAERTTPAQPGTVARVLYDDFAAWFRANPAFSRRTVLSSIDFGRKLTRAGVGMTAMRDGKYRHLVLNQPPGGTWFTGPEPVPVTAPPIIPPVTDNLDCGGSVTDAEVDPSHENAQVQPQNDLVVTDVTDNPYMFGEVVKSKGKIGKVEYTGEYRDPSVTVTPVTETAPTSENAGDGSSSASVTGPAPERTSVIDPVLAKRARRSASEPKRQTPAQLRKAEEKAAKVAELAGPVLELPVVVRRTAPTPRHVEHVHVGPLLTDAMAKSEGHLTVDVETSGYPIGHPLYALRTIQLGTRVLAVDLDADCAPCCAIAIAALSRATVLHAHNACADIPALHHAGIADHHALWAKMEDTVLPAKLADPSSSGGDPALKAASAAVLGANATSPAADEARSALFAAAGWLKDTEPTTPAEKSGWLQVDKRCATMQRYACADVLDGALLALSLPAPDPAVHARERHIQRIVAPTATFGFPLDREQVLAQHDQHDADEKRLREQLCDTLKINNPGSPKQLGEAFTAMGVWLPATPGGAASTAKDVLKTLSERQGPAQAAARLVLDWRHHDTALKLLLRPWRIAVLQGDGRVRPTVYTLGADTGRMSCVRPNLQQVSKKGGLRECILADDGYLIVSADFEGVELRVAAALSGDQVLAGALAQGLDIHRMIAAAAFGEALADENRGLAKRIVFGHIYGGGYETLAKQAGVTPDVVAACVDALRRLTPRLSAWSEEIKSAIRAGNRAFKTYSGRVIHLDPRFPHKGPNYLIQGTARELLGDGLIDWDATEHGGGILMPVHDEAVAMVRADRAQDGLDTLLRCFTRQLGDIAITAEAGGPPSRSWVSG